MGPHVSSLASPVFGISAKHVEKVKKNPKTSERIPTLPDVSKGVRMHPSRSEQVPARLRSHENLENFAKTSRKLREVRASAAVDLGFFFRGTEASTKRDKSCEALL